MNDSAPSVRTTLTIVKVIERYHAARRLEGALAASGTTTFQVVMLAAIAVAPVGRLRDIGDTLGVSSSVLTLGIDRLERQGLVARAARRSLDGPPDRRQVRVALTEAGRDLLARLATLAVEP